MVSLRKNHISQEFGRDGLLVKSKQDKQTAAALCRHSEKWFHKPAEHNYLQGWLKIQPGLTPQNTDQSMKGESCFQIFNKIPGWL